MVNYVTRVSVWFYSEGASPSAVITRLMGLGFRPVRGSHDFVYEHKGHDLSESDLTTAILEIANGLHKALSGFKVLYNLETGPVSDASDDIPLEIIDAELEQTRREIESAESDISPKVD
ncbi:MAG: hypothetical protein QXS20_05280 [Candidatus Thorarchaeota archaeon]